MGNRGYFTPRSVDLRAPTYIWFLGPACSTVGSTIDQIQKHNCEKDSRTTLFLLPEAVCKKTALFWLSSRNCSISIFEKDPPTALLAKLLKWQGVFDQKQTHVFLDLFDDVFFYHGKRLFFLQILPW